MDVDIYGDLDNLDDQFDVVQKENEQLKETVQKLEETSIKFSIEINELKRINSNLEVNISSLYKTAKAEIERKNKQIAELRKDLDNMLFKRGSTRKVDTNDGSSQEKHILTKQFEKAKHDIDQKNRIIQSLNSELENVRKELAERNNGFKRNSSQIEEGYKNNFNAKKPKLEKETFVENEEDYRNYKNRYEIRKNDHYNQRSKSPNYRRYNSKRQADLRSRIDLKRINYRRSRSRSREDFGSMPLDKRNNRPNYRDTQSKGRYAERSESPMEYNSNDRFTYTVDNEKQNYFSEQDSGVFNSQTTESSYIQESVGSEPSYSVSPVLSHDDVKLEIVEGGLNNTKLTTDDSKFKKNINPPKLTDKHIETQYEKSKHNTKRSNKTNASVASNSNISEKSVTETVNYNPPIVPETKPYNLQTTKNDNTNIDQELSELEKVKEKIRNEIIELEIGIEKKKSKSVVKKTENNSAKLSKIINEKNEAKEKIVDTANTELRINEYWEVVQDETNKEIPKIETKKTDGKSFSELHSSKSNKDNSKFDKSKVKNSASEKKSDLISAKEKTKTPSNVESKFTKSKQEKAVVKSTERIISESKSRDYKTKKINFESKDTNISIVSELNPVTNKKERKISESSDTNIKIVSQIKPSKTKKEKKTSESNDTNISVVSELQPAKVEKTFTELTETNISFVSETKNENSTPSAETNLTASEMKKVEESEKNKPDISKLNLNIKKNEKVDEIRISDSTIAETNLTASEMKKVEESEKNKPDISKLNLNIKKNEKVDEIRISESTIAVVQENSSNILSTDTLSTNLKQNESEISNITTINLVPSTSTASTSKEENCTSNIESQNIETTSRKPPIKGRRRRCIISIT